MITRRDFLQKTTLTGAAILLQQLPAASGPSPAGVVMTVNGPIRPGDMGFTLSHEHILLGVPKDPTFVYNAEDVYVNVLPLLADVKAKGCATFIDCTPSNLGRDVKVCRRLSQATGLNILTNTGYYGAGGEKYLPPHVYTESAQQLADRWIAEWKKGIGDSDIKPGFIKTSVDNGPLSATQQKLVEAAGIAHLATGLTIAIHTGDGKAAVEELEILKKMGVSPAARIWIHAGEEPDFSLIIAAAQQNSWVSFDHVNPSTIAANIGFLKKMKDERLLDHVLVSQDSGFYQVGKPGGGVIKPYTCVLTEFIPAVKQQGFTQEEVDRIFIANPAKAFTIGVRKK